MRILIFVLLFSLPSFGFASEAIEHLGDLFTASLCAEMLGHERTTDFEVHAKAEEVIGWVTLRHPTVRHFLARDNSSMDRFYDLLFLSMGFMVPPDKTGRFQTVTEPNRRFEAGVRFHHPRWPEKNVGRGRDALVGTFPQLASSPSSAAKFETDVALLANVILRSTTALSNLTHQWNRYGDKDDAYRPLTFTSDRYKLHKDLVSMSDWELYFTIKWGKTFSVTELDTLRATLSHLNDAKVRAVVLQRLQDLLPTLVSESLELCRAWSKCTNVEEARAALDRLKAMDQPRAIDSQNPTASAIVSAPRSRSIVSEKPVPFESEAIQEFLRAHPKREGAVESVVEVMRELQAATDLLIDSLFQIQSWRSHDVDWSAWGSNLQASKESLLHLRQTMSSRQGQLAEALGELEKGMTGLNELRGWATAMNEYLNQANLKERAPQFSPADQSMLRTVLTMATALDRLMSDANHSIQLRQRLVTETIDAIFTVQVMIAKVGESLVRESGALVRIEDQAAFAKLRESLEHLARPEKE